MAPLKLTYFDVPGAGEPIRWALEVGGLEWEDQRLARDEIAALKPTLPNGQLPVLTVDGFMLPQSLAILRYVGKIVGLYPTDDLEAAKCDAIMDCSTDIVVKIRPCVYEEDEEKKIAMIKEVSEGFAPVWLGYMSKHLEEASGIYFCCGKLTIADLVIVSMIRSFSALDAVDPDILEPFPKIVALVKIVSEEPKIAAFIAKHAK